MIPLAFTTTSVPSLPSAVILRFETYREELTYEKRLEAKAIDPATELPVVSLPLTEMAAWLKEQGYRWLSGSSGIWERSVA